MVIRAKATSRQRNQSTLRLRLPGCLHVPHAPLRWGGYRTVPNINKHVFRLKMDDRIWSSNTARNSHSKESCKLQTPSNSKVLLILIFHSYFIHISFIFHSYFIHISFIFHSYFIHISFIFHSYFIHISFIFHIPISGGRSSLHGSRKRIRGVSTTAQKLRQTRSRLSQLEMDSEAPRAEAPKTGGSVRVNDQEIPTTGGFQNEKWLSFTHIFWERPQIGAPISHVFFFLNSLCSDLHSLKEEREICQGNIMTCV